MCICGNYKYFLLFIVSTVQPNETLSHTLHIIFSPPHSGSLVVSESVRNVESQSHPRPCDSSCYHDIYKPSRIQNSVGGKGGVRVREGEVE